MTEPTPRQRLPASTVAFGLILAAVLGHLAIVAGDTAPWLMWLLAPVYAAYVMAIVLVAAAVVGRVRGRPPLPIPGLPAHMATHPRATLVLAGVVGLVTLVREGAFAPELLVSYDVYQAEHRIHASHDSSYSSTVMGDAPAEMMAGRPVICHLRCANAGTACDAVLEGIRCDNHRDPGPEPRGAVFVDGMIRVDTVDCYTPLWKQDTIGFGAQLDLSLTTDRIHASVGLSLDGALDQEATGPMSCHGFARLAAQQIVPQLRDAIVTTLRSH